MDAPPPLLARRLARVSFYSLLAFCSMGMTAFFVAWLMDFDFRFEDERERAIREFASAHRATDLRFPGAAHQPVRSLGSNIRTFDLTSSALSFVEQELDSALVSDPGNSRLLFLRSQVYLLNLQPAPAIDILERLRPFSPEDPAILGSLGYAHYVRGRADSQMGDLLRALDFFEKALSIAPEDPVLLFNTAIVYQRLGKRDEAQRHFQKVLDRDSTSGWAMEAKARMIQLTRGEP
mgnify:CR=1 FL=1